MDRKYIELKDYLHAWNLLDLCIDNHMCNVSSWTMSVTC